MLHNVEVAGRTIQSELSSGNNNGPTILQVNLFVPLVQHANNPDDAPTGGFPSQPL